MMIIIERLILEVQAQEIYDSNNFKQQIQGLGSEPPAAGGFSYKFHIKI